MRVLWLCALIWAQLVGLLGVSSAWAETFQVDALKILPDVAWQRGEAEREENESLYLLRWSGDVAKDVANDVADDKAKAALIEVAIPRRGTVLKNDAESFLYHLGKIWAAQYGRRAEIDEVKINDRTWLVCRRPSADQLAQVFQFASVHEGRAYSLVAFVPRTAKGVPKPVFDLVRNMEFKASTWRLARTIPVQPGREALAALADLDAEHLGKNGLLTGYGVDYRGNAVDWFVEGYIWRGGVKERHSLGAHGHLQATPPDSGLSRLALDASLTAVQAGMAVDARLLDACAAPAALDDALARLERGARAPLEKLQRERPSACPEPPTAAPPLPLQVAPGQAANATFEFALPPAWHPATSVKRAQIVVLKPRLAADSAFGENLTQALGLYVVYQPE